MDTIKIKIPRKFTIKDIDNPISTELQPVVDALMGYKTNLDFYGVKPYTDSEFTYFNLSEEATKDFTLGHFRMLVSLPGVDISGYLTKAYFKVADINASVPSYLPNAYTTEVYDETGETVIEPSRVKTWTEWVGNNYTITEADGYYYFLNYSGDGKPLGNDIVTRLLDDGIELVDKIPDSNV